MSKKYRKQKPVMGRDWWLDADGCWFCMDKNGCSNCKAAKQDVKSKFNKRKKRRENNGIIKASERDFE